MSIVLLLLFLITWLFGQAVSGLRESNKDRLEYGHAPLVMKDYLTTAHFLEATSENWESEFLQMAVYVFLTVFLFQKGSSESKNPDLPEPINKSSGRPTSESKAPWPVRRGGWVLKVYENSLTLAFLTLFLISFVVHLFSGCANYNNEQAMKGKPPITVLEYLNESRFWFESLQNWQSEFLAIFSMVILSIFLRQKGSPESKSVGASHSKTGK